MPGGDLYDRAVSLFDKASPGNVLCGVLWHQGESDSGGLDLAESYGERFEKMIVRLREDLDMKNVPVIAGELGYFLSNRDSQKYLRVVNRRLSELEENVPSYGLVSAENLSDNGDDIHFNAASLREFGRRYARKYIEICSRLFS